MAILNYTTKIDYHKTIGEITKILVSHGASKISIDYDIEGLPVALTFSVLLNQNQMYFSLPARHAGVLSALQKAKVPNSFLNKDQSVRISWRIIKDWVEAQMAIVEAELAELSEVFLPYAIMEDGQTIYEKIKGGGTKFLK
jgi:hypothetical protein